MRLAAVVAAAALFTHCSAHRRKLAVAVDSQADLEYALHVGATSIEVEGSLSISSSIVIKGPRTVTIFSSGDDGAAIEGNSKFRLLVGLNNLHPLSNHDDPHLTTTLASTTSIAATATATTPERDGWRDRLIPRNQLQEWMGDGRERGLHFCQPWQSC